MDFSKAPSAELTRLLGISELRTGRHILRDERGWRDDETWVTRLWHAKIMPSFDDWGLVGLAEFSESEFRGRHHPACMKAAVVTFEQGSDVPRVSEWAELPSDPLRALVRAVDLMPEDQSRCLDGISYMLTIDGSELSTRLCLSNPTQPGLVAVQAALLEVCERVQEATQSKALRAFLKTTSEYTR